MRYRAPFTLLKIKHKSGRVVYYYRTYDENNKRTTAKSTGRTSKSAAMAFCNDLFKRGALISTPKSELLFEDIARDWWVRGKCNYIKSVERRGGTLTNKYISSMRGDLVIHILPKFSKCRVCEITSTIIEDWLFELQSIGLAGATINKILLGLNMILNEAVKNKVILSNPSIGVKRLKLNTKQRSIMTAVEVRKIFDQDNYKNIWSSFISYAASLLASCSGMRIGEVRALNVQDVLDDHIHVHMSFSYVDGLGKTKTEDERWIPLTPYLQSVMSDLKKINPEGFIFSNDGGKNPPPYVLLSGDLYAAMHAIGISEEERRKRNISFHSWRHFLNTTLRSANISDGKVQKLTGHRSQKMTEHYTHFNVDSFRDITGIQESIIGIHQSV